MSYLFFIQNIKLSIFETKRSGCQVKIYSFFSYFFNGLFVSFIAFLFSSMMRFLIVIVDLVLNALPLPSNRNLDILLFQTLGPYFISLIWIINRLQISITDNKKVALIILFFSQKFSLKN
jgi:hypothetical protein